MVRYESFVFIVVGTIDFKPSNAGPAYLLGLAVLDQQRAQGKPIQWRHNERGCVLNHRRLDCLLSCPFRRRSKKTPKLAVAGLCEGNSPVIFPFEDVIMCKKIVT